MQQAMWSNTKKSLLCFDYWLLGVFAINIPSAGKFNDDDEMMIKVESQRMFFSCLCFSFSLLVLLRVSTAFNGGIKRII
jgi:hypothetical protein